MISLSPPVIGFSILIAVLLLIIVILIIPVFVRAVRPTTNIIGFTNLIIVDSTPCTLNQSCYEPNDRGTVSITYQCIVIGPTGVNDCLINVPSETAPYGVTGPYAQNILLEPGEIVTITVDCPATSTSTPPCGEWQLGATIPCTSTSSIIQTDQCVTATGATGSSGYLLQPLDCFSSGVRLSTDTLTGQCPAPINCLPPPPPGTTSSPSPFICQGNEIGSPAPSCFATCLKS